MSAIVISAESVAIELRAYARARTPLQAYASSTPALDELVGATELAEEARLEVIQAAIEAVLSQLPPRVGSAAEALFPSTPTRRWTALKQRGPDAAAAFETTYHAARTPPKDGGRSLLDDVHLRVATALIARFGVGTADGGEGGEGDLAESAGAAIIDLTSRRGSGPAAVSIDRHPGSAPRIPADTAAGAAKVIDAEIASETADRATSRRRRRVRRWVPAVAVGVVALMLGVWAFLTWSGSRDAVADGSTDARAGSARSSTECEGEAGVAGTDDGTALGRTELGALRRLAGSRRDLVCPAGVAEVWGQLGHQPFRDTEGRRVQLVVGADEQPLVMPDGAFSAYFVAGGKNGSAAQALMGLPTGERHDDDGRIYTFSSGGMVVGERDDGPFFYLLGPAAQAWTASGAWRGSLGAPTSLVWPWEGTFRQDFEKGYLHLTDGGAVATMLVPDGSNQLTGLDRLRGHIVRQGDGTAWWIDDEGRREWISDGPTWDCLGGQAAVAQDNVLGYSINAVPAGPTARCP